jgi:hypothetical protein
VQHGVLDGIRDLRRDDVVDLVGTDRVAEEKMMRMWAWGRPRFWYSME